MTLYLGLNTRLLVDFVFDYHALKGVVWFNTTTKKAKDYIEITLYGKGGLWKIRKYIDHYWVYYGTQKKLYSTTLQGAIEYVSKFKNN